MKTILSSCLSVILALSCYTLGAQSETTTVRVKPQDLEKMTRVELQAGDKVFPKSYLYKTNRSSIVILPGSIEDDKGRTHYLNKEVSFNDVDYITIYSHKRKVRSSIIGGIVGGVGSYFVTDQLGKKRLRQPSLELLGQTPTTRIVEPIVAGFVGAGIGIIVGEMLAPLKLSTKTNKRELQQKLKQFSYR